MEITLREWLAWLQANPAFETFVACCVLLLAAALTNLLVKRIIAELRGAILAGQYGVGDKLPSQAELAEQYQVSRTVVR
ncbi:MAG: FadR/GntR family transcriptional regulator, partial [Rhodanobacter sp.]